MARNRKNRRKSNPGMGIVFLAALILSCASGLQTLQTELSDPRAWVRADALDRLGHMQGPQIRELILPGLSDPEADVRRRAIRSLAKHARPQDGRYFTKALSDSDWQVRYEASQALASIGKPSVEALVYQLQTTDGAARMRVIEALGQHGDRRATPHLVRLIEAGSSDTVIQAAAKALGQIKDPAAVDPLVALISQRLAHSRYTALEALVSIGVPALEGLIPLMEHPDPDTAAFAVEAIGRIGSPRGLAALKHAAVQSAHDEIRVSSLGAMGRIGGPESIRHLTTYLNNRDPNVVTAAQKAIARTGATAVEPLLAMLEAATCGDCRVVLKTLSMLGPLAVPSLVAALRDATPGVQTQLRGVLVKMGQPAVAPLMTIFEEASDPLTHPAAGILPQIGKPAIRPLFARLTKDPEKPPVWAREMLVAIGPPAVSSLIDALEGNHQLVAAELLAQIGEAAVLPLIALLNHERWNLRLSAARILGQIGDVRAAAPLVTAMANWFVGPGAAEALSGMGWLPLTNVQKVHLWVGQRDAVQLLANWPLTRDILYGYLASGVKDQLEYAVFALIGLGADKALGPLIHTLNTTGYEALALVFRASRNPQLVQTGQRWAQTRGLDVDISSDAGFVKWGEMAQNAEAAD